MLYFFVFFFVVMSIAMAVIIYKLNDRLTYYKSELAVESETTKFWYDKWREYLEANVTKSMELEASEQGVIEIEENYQQEILDLIDKTNEHINAENYWQKKTFLLEQMRLDHQEFCLPILGEQILDTDDYGDTPVYDSVVFDRIG